MDCSACEDRLWEYAEGSLTPVETAQVDEQVRRCPRRAAALEATQRTRRLLRRQPTPEPSVQVRQTLWRALQDRVVTLMEVAELCRLLSVECAAGPDVALCLRRAAERASLPRLGRIARDLAEAAETAGSLSAAWEQRGYLAWPPFLTLVRQGEERGTLPETLARLAGVLEGEVALRRQVIAATDRPAFVALGVVAAAGAALETRRHPDPSVARAAVLGAGVVAMLAGARRVRRGMRGGLRFPWVRRASRRLRGGGAVERLATWAEVADVLAGAGAQGVEPAEGLRAAAEATDDAEVRTALEQAAVRARTQPLSLALRGDPLLPSRLAETALLAEETGSPDALFGALAVEYRKEIAVAVQRLGLWAKPVVFGAGGVLVGMAAGAALRVLRKR